MEKSTLFPIQILFGTAVLCAKTIYKSSLYKRYSASVPVLVVGNLASGGTGKTPMVDYILTHFSKQYVLGMLSRGYGRQTKGYRHVSKHSRANEVGDEPLMLAQKHANVVVSVCERRPEGIQKMQSDFPNIQALSLMMLYSIYRCYLRSHCTYYFSKSLVFRCRTSCRGFARASHGES